MGNKREWLQWYSEEEDRRLMAHFEAHSFGPHGNFTEEESPCIRWSEIASQLPGKTENHIKNNRNTHIERQVLSGSVNQMPITTISLFPIVSGDDGNKTEEENISVASTSISEKTLSNVRTKSDLFWEQFLTIRPNEDDIVGEKLAAEPHKLIERKNSESSTLLFFENEDQDVASFTGSPPRPEDLQNEQNMVLQNEDNTVLQLDSYNPQVVIEDALHNVRNDALGVEQSSSTTFTPTNKTRVIKTPQREHVTTKISFSLEVLKQHFGMKIDDAADSLGISRSSFKRICRENGIERWPSRKRKRTNRSPCNLKNMTHELVGAAEERINESNNREPRCFDSPPKETATVVHTIPLIAAPSQNANSSVTIKATYGDDIIKFQLLFSSRMDDLREKVAKRLNLDVGTFKLKHKDVAGDLVLITCDEDLQDCMCRCRSSDKATIDMLVLPVTNQSGFHNQINAPLFL